MTDHSRVSPGAWTLVTQSDSLLFPGLDTAWTAPGMLVWKGLTGKSSESPGSPCYLQSLRAQT